MSRNHQTRCKGTLEKLYCATLHHTTRLSTVWAMNRKMNGVYPISRVPIIIQDGKPVESSTEKAELFANIFESVSSNLNNTPEFNMTKATTERENDYLFDMNSSTNLEVSTSCLNDCFNIGELQRAIRRAKSDSKPGKDRSSLLHDAAASPENGAKNHTLILQLCMAQRYHTDGIQTWCNNSNIKAK